MHMTKNDPDFVFEEYKGYTIASHKNNVDERSIDNLIIVYPPGDFPEYGFIIGLDDSKMHGGRKSVPNNMEDARNYIEWNIKVRQENKNRQQLQKQKSNRPKRRMRR